MVPRLMWATSMMSLLVFGAVAHFVVQSNEPVGAPPALLLALGVAALSCAVGAWVVPGRMEGGAQGIENAMRRASSAPDPLAIGIQAAMPPFLLRLAMLEAVAVLGLVATLQSGDPMHYAAFASVALVNMVFADFPRRRVEEAWQNVSRERAS